MASNQVDSPSLLASKIVPLVTLHWVRQAEHCQYSRLARRNELWTAHSQSGQIEALGPARRDHSSLTQVVAAVAAYELSHRQAALELDLVYGHDLPSKLVRPSSSRSGS